MAAHEPSNQVARQQFVEEINYNEIKRLEVVGKGSFGVVWKGRWREKLVAVKHINSEAERKAFTVEVRQLSRVSHPNIVKLYGACTREPHVCLVMEYAEGGSLYNVLHCKPQPRYTAAHAMSWALQCAQGVEYLHAMKPKPLIHRDLKPPNLLLLLGGQRLKICDFGTAADQSTYMTNNKGSAAWMAPEVFECTSYTEKCDVFSWGVILWEVLSRHKPFDHNGRSAYQIMWAVHMGNRPPLLRGCPRPIEKLMVACWEKNPSERPSMGEVVRIMSALCQFFPGAEEPVEYSSDESWIDDTEDDNESLDYTDYTVGMDNFDNYSQSNGIRNISIPQPNQNMMTPMSLDIDPNAWDLSEHNRDYFAFGDNLNSAPSVTQTEAPVDPQVCQSGIDTDQSDPDLDNVYLILDPHLRPVSPDPDGPQSLQVFEEHKKLAQQYFKVQTELAYLSRYRDEVLAKQDSEQQAQRQRLSKLQSERDGLVPLHKNLTRQLEIMKKSGNMSPPEPRTPTNDGWIVVSRQGD